MTDGEKDAIELDNKLKRLDAEETAGKAFGDKLDQVLEAIGCIRTDIAACNERMDAIEKKGGEEMSKAAEQEEKEAGLPLAADSWEKRNARNDAERKERDENINAQSRADSVAVAWGERAPPPMMSEKPRAYRERLLSRFQKHSDDYKEVDLAAIKDEKLFGIAESKIYADAAEAAKRPNVADGELRCITHTTDGGHRVNEYYGQPSSWMNEFAGPVRQVVKGGMKGFSTSTNNGD